MDLAQEFLMSVRTGAPLEEHIRSLSDLDRKDLGRMLKDEQVRRAFWINSYNGFAAHLLAQEPVDLRSRIVRSRHYGRKRIVIAGHRLSLNDIEHGLLRGSRIWWAKGHLRNRFPGRFEKQCRVPLDPRIHFALNCGAVSCPPVAYYDGGKLNEQLDVATSSFLHGTVDHDPRIGTITLSPLFNWYSGDMGGVKGTFDLLVHYGFLPEGAQPFIRFAEYDWATAPSE